MSPEFGSTCGIFPIDDVTLDYLRLTGRSEEQVELVKAYAKANRLWGDTKDPQYVEPQYSEYMELDLGTVVPSIAGPKRPQDRITLATAKQAFENTLPAYETEKTAQQPIPVSTDFRGDFDVKNGDVAIASITSCTNTSNPSVMIAAGLIARNAHAKGLKPKPPSRGSKPPSPQAPKSWPTTSRKPASKTTSTPWATSSSASAAPPASATPARCCLKSPKPSTTTT